VNCGSHITRACKWLKSLISGLPPEYEALIEWESEEMDMEKPDHIVKRLKDDLGYIEQKQKQRAEYELTQDGCDILDCQELGQKLKHAGYVQLNQTDGDNSTFEITEKGQKIIERNDDVCEVLKDDLEYIEQKQKQEQEYELTKHGHPVAIKSRQRIEKTNLNLYVIALSALGIGFSLVVSMGLSIFALFIPVGVLLIILPLARSKAWTR
jgi:predicted transcriptional regulator